MWLHEQGKSQCTEEQSFHVKARKLARKLHEWMRKKGQDFFFSVKGEDSKRQKTVKDSLVNKTQFLWERFGTGLGSVAEWLSYYRETSSVLGSKEKPVAMDVFFQVHPLCCVLFSFVSHPWVDWNHFMRTCFIRKGKFSILGGRNKGFSGKSHIPGPKHVGNFLL